jgi:hypothetical protein
MPAQNTPAAIARPITMPYSTMARTICWRRQPDSDDRDGDHHYADSRIDEDVGPPGVLILPKYGWHRWRPHRDRDALDQPGHRHQTRLDVAVQDCGVRGLPFGGSGSHSMWGRCAASRPGHR